MEKIYFQSNVASNRQKLQHVQDVMSLAIGIGAGVLGLESLSGFIFFLMSFSLCNFSFYFFCCEKNESLFFCNPLKEIFLDGIPKTLAGFIMMWCLTYALVK